MKIGIDLDETLINNKVSIFNIKKWNIKKGVKEVLPLLYNSHELHIITARSCKSDVMEIISIIEQKLSIQFKSITLTYYQNKGRFAASIEVGVKSRGNCPLIKSSMSLLFDILFFN
jgi:uncharacterized HAD superfamily protein